MSDLDSFARVCKTTSRNLRRIPGELRKELAGEVQTEVAQPLATRIAGAASGSYGRPLATAVKARKLADPTIVIGGTRRVVSGGASARQLVYGTEFGGGSRLATVPSTSRARGHRRRTTRQFLRNRRPFVFPTIARSGGWVLDRYADIVGKVLDREVNRG